MSTVSHFYQAAEQPCSYNEALTSRHIAVTPLPRSRIPENRELARAFKFEKLAKGYLSQFSFAMANICQGCNGCVGLRVNIDRFALSKSQEKRFIRQSNYNTRLIDADRAPFDDLYKLYLSYIDSRHPDSGMSREPAEFTSWLMASAWCTLIQDEAGEIAGFSLLDHSGDSFSYEYSVYDTTRPKDSLGKHLWLATMMEAKQLGVKYAYVGAWVKDSPVLDYKKSFAALEAFIDGQWIDFDSNIHTRGSDHRVMLRADGMNI